MNATMNARRGSATSPICGRVDVYRNLHKRCYSIRQQGFVVAHAPTVMITDAKLVVHPGGRDRVRATGHKNVHAFIQGTIVEGDWHGEAMEPIRYDPYRFDGFVDRYGNVVNYMKTVLCCEDFTMWVLR